MRDFHHPDPEMLAPDFDFVLAAIIGLSCLGMLAAGIVIGAFVSGTFSAGVYGALLLIQFLVTHACIWRLKAHSLRWMLP